MTIKKPTIEIVYDKINLKGRSKSELEALMSAVSKELNEIQNQQKVLDEDKVREINTRLAVIHKEISTLMDEVERLIKSTPKGQFISFSMPTGTDYTYDSSSQDWSSSEY